MATATKEAPTKKEVAKTKTNEETTAIALNGATISRAEAVEALNAMTEGDLDSGYLEFEVGQVVRVLFTGWKKIPGLGDKQGSEVDAAQFLVSNGKEQINADAVVISYFQKQAIGCARQITCTGEKTTGRGTYKTFKFHELNMKK